ncbi:hypothetical protein PFISCL1PPCAC_6501, partial [Pristionchus fissidentatus]
LPFFLSLSLCTFPSLPHSRSLFLFHLSPLPQLKSTTHTREMYASTQKSSSLHCLICAAPINHAHLGIDACRACAVFYKRHATLRKPLVCRRGTNDCYEKNVKPFCRKCRFIRFSAVLGNTLNDPEFTDLPSNGDSMDPGSSESSEIDLPEYDTNSFIDHRSFSLSSPFTSESPFFDRMRRAYSLLCVIRRCGEVGTCPNGTAIDEVQELAGDGIEFMPAVFSMKIPNARLMFAALIPFFDACFDDFRVLSAESKHFIINRSCKLLTTLDGLYRAVHHFPDDDTLLPYYTSYFNSDMLENYVDSSPMKVNREEVIKAIQQSLDRTVHINKADYKRMLPSDDEFLALMGLSLWNNEISSLNEEHMEMVTRNRSEIMSELHKMYARQGMNDYAARLGEILCLLVNIEKTSAMVEEDLQLWRLMNMFNDDMSNLRC